mgnify:CR=1 FL=1
MPEANQTPLEKEIAQLGVTHPCPTHGKHEVIVSVKPVGLTQAQVRTFTCCAEHRTILKPEAEKIIQSYGLELVLWS